MCLDEWACWWRPWWRLDLAGAFGQVLMLTERTDVHLLSLSLFQTLLVAQEITLTAENEEDLLQDAACQDHMIGTVPSLLFNQPPRT